MKSCHVLVLVGFLFLTGCENFVAPHDATPSRVTPVGSIDAANNAITLAWGRGSPNETYSVQQKYFLNGTEDFRWVSLADDTSANTYSVNLAPRRVDCLVKSQSFTFTFRVRALQGDNESEWTETAPVTATYWLTNATDFTVTNLGSRTYRAELRLKNSGNTAVNSFESSWMASNSGGSTLSGGTFQLKDLHIAPGDDLVLSTGEFTTTEDVAAVRLYWSGTRFSN